MRFADLKLAHRGLVVVGIFLLAELLLLGSLALLVAQSRAEAVREANSKNFSGKLSEILRSIQEITLTVTADAKGKDNLLDAIQPQHVRADLAKLRVEIKDLQQLSHSQPEYRARTTKLTKKFSKVIDLVGDGLTAIETNDLTTIASVAAVCGARSPVQTKITEESELLISEQRIKQAAISQGRQQLRSAIEILLGLGILADVILALLLGKAFVKGITDRLLLLSHNTECLASGASLAPAMDQHDEIGLLDHAFREMSVKITELAHKQKAIIENTHDVICSLSEDLRFVTVSPAASNLWGYEPDRLIGTNLLSVVNSTDSAEYRNVFQKCIADDSGDFELPMRHKDGSDLQMLWSARWSESDQNMFCVAHDITERKRRQRLLEESEQNLRSMLDTVLSGLLICSYQGQIEYCNQRLCDMLGISPDSASSMNVMDLFEKKPSIAADSFLADQLERSKNHILEFEIKHPTGNAIPVEMSFTDLDAIDGKRLLINIADITERRQIERTKQEFVAMVSHDLRTPLASVGGFLELLIEEIYGELTPERSAAATQSHENVDALLRIINDLLEITKLEAGKLEMDKKKHVLSRLANIAFELVQTTADKFNVSLEFHEPDAQISADKSRFCRVLENVLFYAISNSSTPSQIKISALESREQIEILISAPDLYLSETRCATLFDRFGKGASSDAKPILSLAICKAIISELGGKITATQADTGTNFKIDLPS